MSMFKNNKELVIHYVKRLWEERDTSVVDELVAENCAIHSPFTTIYGSMSMKAIMEKWMEAFPNLALKWDDFIAEDDKVVSLWHATGTHMGSFFETTPTHQEVKYSGVTTYKIYKGKIVEYWALVDMHAILSQLKVYGHISEAVE